MLKVVEKALEKDSVKNILKYDKDTKRAEIDGLCNYLVLVSNSMNLDFSDMCRINAGRHHGVMHYWMHSNYIFKCYIYPSCEDWDKRLKILRKFRTYLKKN